MCPHALFSQARSQMHFTKAIFLPLLVSSARPLFCLLFLARLTALRFSAIKNLVNQKYTVCKYHL